MTADAAEMSSTSDHVTSSWTIMSGCDVIGLFFFFYDTEADARAIFFLYRHCLGLATGVLKEVHGRSRNVHQRSPEAEQG